MTMCMVGKGVGGAETSAKPHDQPSPNLPEFHLREGKGLHLVCGCLFFSF